MKIAALLAPLVLAASSMAFAPASTGKAAVCRTASESPVVLSMANDNDLRRWEKSSRAAGAGDRVVELRRPLGLVLNEDGEGNVYVETVAPRGNAARTGEVKEGDLVTMCSATFGDQMWSCRGAGLTRVLAAIRVRAGPTVKLVFESTTETKAKAQSGAKAAKAAEDARAKAQAKRDQLLDELERDEKKLKKGKFLGLF